MAYQEIKGRDRVYKITITLGYEDYVDKNGVAKTRRKYAPCKNVDLSHLTKKQAEKEIIVIEAKYKEEVKGLTSSKENMKFSELVKEFREAYAPQNLRPKTLESYNENLDKRLIPHFGYMKIGEITPTLLLKFYNKLGEETYEKKKGEFVPLSVRTIFYHHQIMSSIMGTAVDWGYIKENPCNKAKPKRPQKNTKAIKEKYWRVPEALAFLEFIRNEPLKYRCFVYLGLLGGLRTEEVLGLDIDDIAENGVTIQRTSLPLKGGMNVEELTKNDSSNRNVVISELVMNELKTLRTEQRLLKFKLQNLWQDGDRILLFTQNNGKPMYGKTPYKWFKKKIKEYNDTCENEKDRIREISVHGLRHTTASLITYLGWSNRAGADILGHALPSTFSDMYGGVMGDENEKIAEQLGILFAPAFSGIQKVSNDTEK